MNPQVADTHFPVDVMMNGFDLSNWNYNNDSDLSSFIIADDSIDLIKDYYDIMTDRLWVPNRQKA
jgi:hypothetical protein